jgi:hypothetical protein
MEDGTMRYLITFALMAGLTLGWADPIPSQLAKALQQRERFYFNRRVVYRVQDHTTIFKPQHREHRQDRLLEVQRTQNILQVTTRPFTGQSIRTEQGTTDQFDPSFGGSTTCYFSLDDRLQVTNQTDTILSTADRSLERATVSSNITPFSPETLYRHIDFGGFCNEGLGMRGVFTIGLDASKLYQVRWQQVEERADRWVLVAKAKATQIYPTSNPNDPDVTLRVELRKPDALPLQLEMLKPFRRPNMWWRHTFRTLQFRRIDGLDIPTLIEHKYEVADNSHITRSLYTFLRLERLKQPLRVQVPKNAVVMDERLGNTLNYHWTGRLMSEEELKRLGYQQGNLIPPETPRRRYSPWLFLPAVLCFLAAGYLYLRQRRK